MENDTHIKVSVLMLAYNQERYIDEAIRSVMLQETGHRERRQQRPYRQTMRSLAKEIPAANRPPRPERELRTPAEFHPDLCPLPGNIHRHLRRRRLLDGQAQTPTPGRLPGQSSRLLHLLSQSNQLLRRQRDEKPQQRRSENRNRHIRPCPQQLHIQRIRPVPPGTIRRTARMVRPRQHLRLRYPPA